MTHTHSGAYKAPVLKLLEQFPKHTIAGDVSCNDALQHMLAHDIHAAIVSTHKAQNLGFTTRQDLQSLCATKKTLPLANNLSDITEICTPNCLAEDVYNRMKLANLAYILVVGTSGDLISFLQTSDFTATLMP